MRSHSPDLGHQSERGSPRSAISNAVVQLHANHYGRGPTKARTHLADEFALVILEDIFTPAERTLIAAGNYEQVVDMRAAFQEALRREFVEAIQAITGREVRAFISAVNVDPEIATELFIFEPQSDRDGES